MGSPQTKTCTAHAAQDNHQINPWPMSPYLVQSYILKLPAAESENPLTSRLLAWGGCASYQLDPDLEIDVFLNRRGWRVGCMTCVFCVLPVWYGERDFLVFMIRAR